ncbi:hypothetical protein EV360DRAFT_75095 [Lentinula raphanica]|nr:hypothetical protein EV360DRAFT_75095 [Lentinula raphanica]
MSLKSFKVFKVSNIAAVTVAVGADTRTSLLSAQAPCCPPGPRAKQASWKANAERGMSRIKEGVLEEIPAILKNVVEMVHEKEEEYKVVSESLEYLSSLRLLKILWVLSGAFWCFLELGGISWDSRDENIFPDEDSELACISCYVISACASGLNIERLSFLHIDSSTELYRALPSSTVKLPRFIAHDSDWINGWRYSRRAYWQF